VRNRQGVPGQGIKVCEKMKTLIEELEKLKVVQHEDSRWEQAVNLTIDQAIAIVKKYCENHVILEMNKPIGKDYILVRRKEPQE